MEKTDLTDAQASLDQSRHWAELYDLAPVACLTFDRHGVIEQLNLTAATLLGVPRGRATGKPFIGYVRPEDRSKFLDHLLHCRMSADQTLELQILCYPDRLLPVQLRTRASQENGARRLSTAIIDLTPLRTAEAERLRLLTARQQAQSASDARDHFLALLSHELRTPLTPVLAAVTSTELNDALPEHLRTVMEMIRRNIRQETRLIDDLLDVTRIANNKLELRRQVINLHEIILGATDLCREELQARQLKLSLELMARAFFADADAARVRQVLRNLLDNAMKFTPAGGQITIRSANTGGEKITISVIDTGRGIDPRHVDRLFQPFEQIGVRPEGTSGLGLGLSIARKLVEAHGGRVSAFSRGLGQGATVNVTLPVVPPLVHPAAAPVPQPAIARPLRILLVDDHVDTAGVMSRLLRRAGHEVRVAMSVRQAIDLSIEPFDLLVSDLGLPDGSGLEIMRSLAAERHIPGIALSGFTSPDDVRQSREAGFSQHMAKPVDFPVLLSTIDHLVKRNPEPSSNPLPA